MDPQDLGKTAKLEDSNSCRYNHSGKTKISFIPAKNRPAVVAAAANNNEVVDIIADLSIKKKERKTREREQNGFRTRKDNEGHS